MSDMSDEVRKIVNGTSPGAPEPFTAPEQYRGVKVPAGLSGNRWEYGFWTQGVDAALPPVEDPFGEKRFVDRLVEWIAETEFESQGCVSGWQVEDVTALLGDRDDLGEKICVSVERDFPLCDGDEIAKGVWGTLAYLFGQVPDESPQKDATHLAAPGVIHEGELSDCVHQDCIEYRQKQDRMRPAPTWTGRTDAQLEREGEPES